MGQKDIVIGKTVSYGIAGIAVLLFLSGSYNLVMYDAEENGIMTLKDGTFKVEDGNEGYRVYTKHTNCDEVEVEFYYDSFFSMGDLIWNPSCSTGFFEFQPATSGEWHYIGTLTFQDRYGSESNEITVNFNVSTSHEVMFTDREPIKDSLGLRNVSGGIFILGVMIYQVTIRTQVERKIDQGTHENQQVQDQFNSPENVYDDEKWY